MNEQTVAKFTKLAILPLSSTWTDCCVQRDALRLTLHKSCSDIWSEFKLESNQRRDNKTFDVYSSFCKLTSSSLHNIFRN